MKANWGCKLSDKPQALLARLHAIGTSLEKSRHGLALIGLGSVGVERSRLDEYSDLDFFAIVRAGYKAQYINDISWLRDVHPIAFMFQNTVDGYKLLYNDDIFCEMAVFEPQELAHIPFAPGHLIWHHPDFDPALAIPAPPHPRGTLESTVAWALGEALTNLYVGLTRHHRGEKLAAQRFIEHFALDRLLELAARIETPTTALADPYMIMRRYESRYPVTAAHLSHFIQGYDRVTHSARAILTWLDANYDVNPYLKSRILELCDEP